MCRGQGSPVAKSQAVAEADVSAGAYSENQLLEQPALALFAKLGWQTVSAIEEVFCPSGTLGQETSGEVALVKPSRATLEKLNPNLPTEATASAVDGLARPIGDVFCAGEQKGEQVPKPLDP